MWFCTQAVIVGVRVVSVRVWVALACVVVSVRVRVVLDLL